MNKATVCFVNKSLDKSVGYDLKCLPTFKATHQTEAHLYVHTVGKKAGLLYISAHTIHCPDKLQTYMRFKQTVKQHLSCFLMQ